MKSYYRFFLVFFYIVLFSSLSALCFAQKKAPAKNQTPISSKTNPKGAHFVKNLEKLILRLMKDADVPGLSVAIVSNGEVVWHGGFGVKNAETKEPISENTVFEAASLSKTVF